MNSRITTMKRILLSLLCCLALLMPTMAQKKKAVQSFLSYTTYNIPDEKPFLENALAFDCSTVVYKEFEPGKFKATVEVQTIFKQDEKVCNFSKIALDSPVVTDTTNVKGSFIDQQRYSLDNGEYQMEVTIKDLNNPNQVPFTAQQTLSIQYPKDQPSVSDILLVDTYSKAETPSNFTKSGFNIMPRVYAYYLANDNELTFYTELYNSDKYFKDGGQYLVNYYLESYESSVKMKDFSYSKRMDVSKVGVLLNTIDLTKLPTGNYYLVVEMRDRTNNLMASNSVFFQRYNPSCEVDVSDLASVHVQETFIPESLSLDSLRESLRCLDPRCSEAERDYMYNLVKTDDAKTMRQFLYTFWANRAPMNPKEAWEEYWVQVQRVNASYSTRTKKGYMSDRGYVYLKYGTPDKICEEPFEPGAYPYEIWHYYQVANQRNKRFVFVSKDTVTNDFELIHSDVVGEVNNSRWQMIIYSRFYGPDYSNDIIDQTAPLIETYGTRAGDLYNNPR